MHRTGRYEARCTSQNLRCPFYERSRISVPLSASLSRVPSQALNHCFLLVFFFLFSPFFLTFVFRVHSNDTISSASFVQEAKENLKKKPRSTVHATRKCDIRTIMSLEVRRVRRIYFAFRASRKCKIFLLASVFVGRPIFAFRAERISPAIALTRPFFRRITCQNI